jgi:SAM-dependent methyltransferase
MTERRKREGRLWDVWTRRKQYDRPGMKRYYQIRDRNQAWLVASAREVLAEKIDVRTLKTDLWNEGKKNERFFMDSPGINFGIDISGQVCRLAKEKAGGRLRVVNASIGFLPFRPQSFDLILDISTIDHFDEPEHAIKEYCRILKPQGVVLIVADNPFYLGFPVLQMQSFFKLHVPFKAFPPSRIRRACEGAGLRVVRSFYTYLHLPAFIAYFLEERRLLDRINQGRSILWNIGKKYVVVLAQKV